MFLTRVPKIVLAAWLVLTVATPSLVRADSPQEKFYKAYYLEQKEGDWAAAADIYEKLASDRSADRELRAKAKARLVVCREELTSSEFVSLMPPDTLVYAELRRPGDQVIKLLDKLGLVAGPDQVVEEGARHIAVSPTLVKEAIGIRGVAVAVTGFDPQKGKPSGVLVFHPGDVEVVRGLLETGLPAGGTAVAPIGGFATYDIEGEVLVTLTSRLVVAGTDRGQIEGVVSRLKGDEKRSLASTDAAESLVHDEDALLSFFVNAKAMMPMIKGLMAAEAGDQQELAIAQAVLDLDSLRSVSGRLGIVDDGISLELGLRLEEGHRNLVYNFFRMPPINAEVLESVPAGVAAVAVVALNEAPSRYASGSSEPYVAAWDLGRELFGNITSFAAYVLLPDGPKAKAGPPIPDVGVVIRVVDPSKSEVLWTQMLGLATLAGGAPAIEGEPVHMDGAKVRRFNLPEHVTIYFASADNDVLIATTESAMARTIHARRDGRSILKDKAFAASIARLGPDTTKAVFAHAGRCAKIAKAFMSPGELKEAEPIMAILSDTAASFVVDHSGEQFRLSAMVSGIPDIGGMVSELATKEAQRSGSRKKVKQAVRHSDLDQALGAVDEQLGDDPGSTKLLQRKFDLLALNKKDVGAALAVAKALFEKTKDDATALNNFAWALLTEEPYGDAYAKLALKFSERSNEITDFENWMFLDTLALANFKTGEVKKAVALEKKAIELCEDCWGADDMKKSLARFKAGSRSAGTGTE